MVEMNVTVLPCAMCLPCGPTCLEVRLSNALSDMQANSKLVASSRPMCITIQPMCHVAGDGPCAEAMVSRSGIEASRGMRWHP